MIYYVTSASLLILSHQSFCQEMPPTAVNTIIVTTSEWQDKIETSGKLKAQQGIVVKSEIPGRISKIKFHSGDFVNKGDLLLEINAQTLNADKRLLETALNLSEIENKRKTNLFKKNAISRSDLDISTAQLKADRAKIEKINIQLRQTKIIAPFSGYLGLRKISIGDYIVPGQEIVNLQATNPIYVDFDVSEKYVRDLKKGQIIQAHSPSYPNEKFEGVIEAFESVINPNSQSLTVRAKLSNEKKQLIPGSFIEVSVPINEKKRVIKIPQTAIIYSSKGNFVFKTAGNTAIKTKVVLGKRTRDSVIISSGLNSGDKIVTIGSMKLYNGAKIIDADIAINKKLKVTLG